ncbi:cytochrome P450 [Crossiella cryophila]|uniref:Nocardicin N-oxygenase n=1 Tax=Crossiella cryophila TaxID=43355 RepID=A0A7W7CHP8_9PSEU|nr:cytochrome P450 [Crossiella cryophila]MBB4681445.1 nocardicin N-oxygenase [Crossiella cryophila]
MTGAPRWPFPGPRLGPPPAWAELRTRDPVSRIRTPAGETAWLLTRYADIRALLSDDRFSVGLPGGVRLSGTPLPGDLLFQDPPRHTELRAMVSRSLSARRIEGLRRQTGELTETLLGELRATGDTADLAAGLTYPLSAGVLARLLGVAMAEDARLRAWAGDIMALSATEDSAQLSAWGAVNEHLAALIEEKTASPGDDVLTDLLATCPDAAELQGLAVSIVVAGYATTANTLNLGLITLLGEPDRYRRLAAAPETVPEVVEEILRWHSDRAGLVRIARTDVELGGTLIRRGEIVLAPLLAAAHDPAAFPDPGRFAPAGHGRPQLAFGYGAHHCLGAALARMELRVALTGLVRAMPDLRLTKPVAELPWSTGRLDDGPEKVPVRW